MNKIAHYLNTHMLGEVFVAPNILNAYSTDASVLHYTPDMVAYPRATSDIRKIARFSWQLAEKGHALPLTVRGAGSDTTGAAIGSGMIIATMPHMNRIFEYDAGQKLIRLQPGVTINAISNALSLHGTAIPELRWDHQMSSIGGSVASQRSAIEYVEQLEIVLANGDVLQTKRLSKRELEKKKGLQTFEGEIYREIDNLISDNPELLDAMVQDDDRLDHEGYVGLEMVKEKNGSFDLAPLFVGSQGSLGIVSEMILKADFVNQNPAVVVATFAEITEARDALDDIEDVDPSAVEFYDAKYFEAAKLAGKTFGFYEEASAQFDTIAAVVAVTINDFNERARTKKLKRLLAKLKPRGAHVVGDVDYANSDLRSLESVTYWLLNPEKPEVSSPPILDGVFVPLDRFDVFSADLDDLMKRHHVALALYGRPLDELWYVRPLMRLSTVADKQKLFKLTTELAALVEKHGGSPFGAGGDGRIGAGLRLESNKQLELFKRLKEIFDPNGTLNPGVKYNTTPRDLARQLRGSYDGPNATSHLAKF